MTTLMIESHSHGRARRCDARCYNAQKPKCRCICGGRNHAQGLAKAAELTRSMVEDTLVEIPFKMAQHPLFPEGGEQK